MSSNSLAEHWMPYTANRDFKAAPRLFVKADGVWYTDHAGRRVLDGCSGLFCVPAGHARREIAQAIHDQVLEIDYISHYQIGAPPAFELARRLAALTPGDLNRLFFTSSGSDAVDTALKIALAYHRARGEGRRLKVVARERAFHGATLAGTTLGGLVNNRRAFGIEIPGVLHMRHTGLPANAFCRGQPEEGGDLADDLKRFIDHHGAETIAACIVEPIAGSTGALVAPRGYLERLRSLCDEHGILLIFDEVITGFGRTGSAFAAQEFGVVPDIVTMAKALTNGCMPMGAVAVREGIHDAIVDSAPAGAIEFFHGHTASGHPVAAAAALATLGIYENEGLFARAVRLSPIFLDAVFGLRDLPAVKGLRGQGMMAAFDLAPGRGVGAMKALFDAGLHVKFTGDTGILAPPFVIDEDGLARMAHILRDVLEKTEA
ncbi:MAG: aminotransferase class III-fold pyridoxal phosphate-dependent enzyme [Magnetospirillum sp. WYHS-4]